MSIFKNNISVLSSLENNWLEYFSLTTEYFTNHQISKDDFSFEYLLNKLIYSTNIYYRASKLIEIDSSIQIKPANAVIMTSEILNDIGGSGYNRFKIFCEEYYSKQRFESLLNGIVENDSWDINTIKDEFSQEKEISFFLLRDEINLINRSGFVFREFIDKKNEINFYTKLEKEFIIVFNNFKDIWTSIYKDIQYYRHYYSLENTDDDKWWFEVKSPEMAVENLKKAIYNLNPSKLCEGAIITNIGIETQDLIPDFIKNIGTNVTSLVQNPKILSLVKSFDYSLAPGKHWGPSENKELVNNFTIYIKQRQQIIEDLIKLIKEESEIDTDRKKDIIATAYFLIGKQDDAIEVLNESE